MIAESGYNDHLYIPDYIKNLHFNVLRQQIQLEDGEMKHLLQTRTQTFSGLNKTFL